MKCKLAPYEKRISQRLPPMSTAEADYLKWKYRLALYDVEFIVKSKIKKENCIDMFHLWGELWDDLISDKERHKITTVFSFENWLIDNIIFYVPNDEKYDVLFDFRRAIIGGRIWRSKIFDSISDKYFNQCVDKLTFAGISRPQHVATTVFEEAENVHQIFEEGENQFVSELKKDFDYYCGIERRPRINLKVFQPLLEIPEDVE